MQLKARPLILFAAIAAALAITPAVIPSTVAGTPVHGAATGVASPTVVRSPHAVHRDSIASTGGNVLDTRNRPLSQEADDFVRHTIGKLYSKFPDGTTNWGTATVVVSDSHDLLLTAAHVIHDERDQRAVELRFVPGESHGAQPFGEWTARDWATVPTYVGSSPEWAQDDIGMVLLNTREGKHIQDVVGSQGVCFDCEKQGFAHLYGYPVDFEGGQALDTHCQVNAVFDGEKPYGTCLEGQPGLNRGSSGAGVLTNFDTTTGVGTVTAINTWGHYVNDDEINGMPTDNGGAYLGGAARALYDQYQSKAADRPLLTVRVSNWGAFDSATTVQDSTGSEVCKLDHVAVAQTRTADCAMPDTGALTVHGQAIAGRGADQAFPSLPDPAMVCFEYRGTTLIGFGFNQISC